MMDRLEDVAYKTPINDSGIFVSKNDELAYIVSAACIVNKNPAKYAPRNNERGFMEAL